MSKIYDVIILGAGPAGLSAGLYSGRARLSTLIIEKGVDGGQIAITDEIENYPGQIPDGETGPELIARFSKQAERFGCERVTDTINKVELKDKIKTIHCTNGTYQARTVVIATGAHPRKIGCPGEDEFSGKGVSYCATCDANFFEELEIYVIGGGDTAVEEAMYLAKFARKVSVVHRRDELRAAKSIQERAFKTENLEFIWNAIPVELKGDGMLQTIVLEDTKTGERREVHADEDDGIFGCFVFIGYLPNSELFKDQLETEWDYILTDEDMKTSVPGVFAAGDVRKKSLRQVVTAAADGAIAAIQCEHYINNNFSEEELQQ
ncbi:MAG: thioredoxin-disulfide reductase [Eubacteriales bacterium]|nr:thioredoxin-disulfide reductase [Eubacteriales bacterium]